MSKILFHLAFPVNDLEETKRFYVEGLGCTLGRESSNAATLELAGNQLVAHLAKDRQELQKGIYPRHFGLVFTSEKDWQAMADRARDKGLRFYQQPRRRYVGTRIEHATFFLEDPSHNLIEFKHYKYETAIFGEHQHAEVGDKNGSLE